MLSSILTFLAIGAASTSAEHHRLEERQADAREGLANLKQQYAQATASTFSAQCNAANIIVRKEWTNMSPEERQDFIRATRCLNDSPSKTPPQFAPGAQNRRDDFVAAHVANGDLIHFSPWTLVFHSYFIWLYEQALRNECGYQGGLPYMAYENYGYQDFEYTALLDGSPLSFGGNGFPSEDDCNCIGGPFSDFKSNLGPTPGGSGCKQNPRADGLGYNPRCIERKFDRDVISNLTYENVYETIGGFHEIAKFGLRIEQWPGGLHPVVHTALGQNDVPSSPCDPMFYTHHAGLDFVWAIWKSKDLFGRTYELPPVDGYQRERQSRGWSPATPVTLDDVIPMSPAFQSITVGEAMSSTQGAFCYVYE